MTELLADLFKHHRSALSAILLIWAALAWFANNKATKVISAFPMPTKDSSPRYIFWFKFFNNLVGNEKRAELPPLEHSPNFQDALKKANETGNAN